MVDGAAVAQRRAGLDGVVPSRYLLASVLRPFTGGGRREDHLAFLVDVTKLRLAQKHQERKVEIFLLL